jgi:hypothetical protein
LRAFFAFERVIGVFGNAWQFSIRKGSLVAMKRQIHSQIPVQPAGGCGLLARHAQRLARFNHQKYKKA